MAIISLFLASLAVYWLGWIIYARWFHPYAKYPGPFLASISRLWYVRAHFGSKVDWTQEELHRKFGPIVRVAYDEVVIADPSALKTIYSVSSGFTKTDFYSTFRPPWVRYPDLFSCTDERLHSDRRKMVNSIYSMSSVIRSEHTMDTCSSLFMDRMTEISAKGEAIDMAVWARWYSFDVIGELFFNRQFGFLEKSEDHKGWINANDNLVPVLLSWALMPSYTRPFLKLAGLAIPRIFKAFMAIQTFDVATDEVIAERQDLLEKNGGVLDREDMLAGIFKIKEARVKELDFGTLEVKSEIYAAMLAGFDTVSTIITAVLYFLMKHPEAYRKLREEIDTATTNGELSSPHIVYNEAAKLPYLHACIKEGMRMNPGVGSSLPRHVPKGGREIAGHFFREGLKVGVNALTIQYNTTIFGDDAHEFKPERWFRENAVDMDRHMFLFGGGQYNCIGKNVAICEMYKFIPELLRSFDLELADPSKECGHSGLWFYKHTDVFTKVTARVGKVA